MFLTSQIEFINESIIKKCKIYKNVYNPIIEKEESNNSYNLYKSFHKEHVCKIFKIIIGDKKINLKELRDMIYEILIYNFDVYRYITDLIELLLKDKYINDNNLINIWKEFTHFIEKYNNNYRAIFHLEYFIIYLMNLNESQ